jgi:uncharacterized protein (TIGR03790 family)
MCGFFQRVMMAAVLVNSFWVPILHGGGSGLNTIVIINDFSSNSCELGNYFCQRRQIPPENVLRISWPGNNIAWTSNELFSILLSPLTNMLASRQLTNQIDYAVLSMDIPFRTVFGATTNSTTSALFYGLKSTGELSIVNNFASSENAFRGLTMTNTPGYSFLATMITAETLDAAKQLVDQGVDSDGQFPQWPVVLEKTSDSERNLRHALFNNAILNVKIRGASNIARTNSNAVSWPASCLGFQTGLANFSVAPGTFVPGAIADSMTSFGGVIFGPNSQTSLLAFVNAGAAGSYGTVAEPGTDTQKFPNPQVYFYQARGFNLAESYYQSVNVPYMGLMVGDPLAAPFARPGTAVWEFPSTNDVISGIAPLSVQFQASDPTRPLQKADLFVDGKYFCTLTNIDPAAGNELSVSLNGYLTAFTVPTNASAALVATGLAASLNIPAVTNVTRARAYAFGDRLELRCMDVDPFPFPFYVAGLDSTTTTAAFYNVTYLPETSPPQVTSVGLDANGLFQMQLQIPTALHYTIEASTNLVDWQSISTIAMPGQIHFDDTDSTNYPMRFYRMSWPNPDQPPSVGSPGIRSDGSFQMTAETLPGQACTIQMSSNLVDWVNVVTNQSGGRVDFVDPQVSDSPGKVYRAWRVPPIAPTFTLLNPETGGVPLVRVDRATLPYQVQVSTNPGAWIPLFTNYALNANETLVSSSIGAADHLSTYLLEGGSQFLTSDAFGFQSYTITTSTPPNNAWLAMTITKTNSQVIVIGATNQSGGIGSVNLAQRLFDGINTNSALQDSAGIVAEDWAVNMGGAASFNVRARSPGYAAALIRVLSARSPAAQTPYFLPAGTKALTNNLGDLQARTHFYVTAGAASLSINYQFDTTTLPDGYHELTAIAYEGGSVRTQTRTTLPVVIQNTALSGNLMLLDLTNGAPVQALYHVQVSATTNDIGNITLFSTGGPLAQATNTDSAVFEISGTTLFAGLHPFYALIESTNGPGYRTETAWINLVNSP